MIRIDFKIGRHILTWHRAPKYAPAIYAAENLRYELANAVQENINSFEASINTREKLEIVYQELAELTAIQQRLLVVVPFIDAMYGITESGQDDRSLETVTKNIDIILSRQADFLAKYPAIERELRTLQKEFSIPIRQQKRFDFTITSRNDI